MYSVDDSARFYVPKPISSSLWPIYYVSLIDMKVRARVRTTEADKFLRLITDKTKHYVQERVAGSGNRQRQSMES